MEFLNNTTEAIAVREMTRERHTVPAEILQIARLTVSTFVLLVNGAIALAFFTQKIRRPLAVRVSPAGLLVLNLLVADALVGVVTIINITTFSASMVQWPYWCNVRLGVSYLVMIGSHIALINVATDRYIAIMYTLHYRDYVTMKRSLVMVCLGWVIPVAGLLGAVGNNDWVPGLVRCSDIKSFKIFLIVIWVPSHILALLSVILIQCRVYFELRRHERENSLSGQILRRFSQKSARILFRVTTIFVLCWGPFDTALVLIVVWRSSLMQTVYDVTLIFAQLSFLVNPLVYSYQTANIRKPVTDLSNDIKKWLCQRQTASQETVHRQSVDVSVIQTILGLNRTTSVSSMHTQSTVNGY